MGRRETPGRGCCHSRARRALLGRRPSGGMHEMGWWKALQARGQVGRGQPVLARPRVPWPRRWRKQACKAWPPRALRPLPLLGLALWGWPPLLLLLLGRRRHAPQGRGELCKQGRQAVAHGGRGCWGCCARCCCSRSRCWGCSLLRWRLCGHCGLLLHAVGRRPPALAEGRD